MKIQTFCKRTGWPYEEFLDLHLSEAVHILALYDCVLALRPKPVEMIILPRDP